MIFINFLKYLYFTCVLMFVCGESYAEEMFSKTTFYFDAGQVTNTIIVFNYENYEVRWSPEIFAWSSNNDGEDILYKTSDFSVDPKEMILKPNSGSSFTITNNATAASLLERSFRIVLSSSYQIKESMMNVNLKHSMPIFLAPDRKTKNGIEIKIKPSGEGRILITTKNKDTTHAFVKNIKVRGVDRAGKEIFSAEQNGWYLLPNKTREYRFNVSKKNCDLVVSYIVLAESKASGEVSENIIGKIPCRQTGAETGFELKASKVRPVEMPQ